jgi:DNA anti-recombination protein RmuC
LSQVHQGLSARRNYDAAEGWTMTPDLEAILLADEEARARVEAARRSAQARIAAAREEIARLKQDQADARAAEVEQRLRAIGEEAERQATARRRRREEYLAGLRRAAEERLSAAAEAWARIVRDGPAGSAP